MPDRLPKANLNLQKSDGNLKIYAQFIHDGMGSTAGLVLYPTPPTALTVFQTEINNFSTAINNAADGGVSNTLAKNAARLVVENTMRQLNRYVTQTCQVIGGTYDEIRANIAISGFEVSAIPSPVGGIPAPTIAFCQSVQSGSIKVRLVYPVKVKSNIAEYKKSTETDFSTFISSSSRFSIPSLEKGATYNVRFRGQGKTGAGSTFTSIIDVVVV